jgi:hypothetical protein
MPDRAEYVHGVGLIEGYLESSIRTNIDDELRIFFSILLTELSDSGQAAVFITSLTTNSNSGKLWEHYAAKRTGKRLKVGSKKIIHEFVAWPKSQRPIPLVLRAPIIYDRPVFIERLVDILLYYANICVPFIKTEGDAREHVKNCIEKLHFLAASYKDDYFRDEEEVRLISLSLTERKNNQVPRYLEGVPGVQPRFSGSHEAFPDSSAERRCCYLELASKDVVQEWAITQRRPQNGLLNISE